MEYTYIMSISRHNLSVIIVSYKSDHVIHRCINSIDKQIEIIVIDNSNNLEFKKNIENKYVNVKCILSTENIGMGAGNNLGIKNVSNDYAFILNPDVTLENGAMDEIINTIDNTASFGVIAPISNKEEYPNYKLDKDHKSDPIKPFKVKSVDGFAMLLNLKKINQIDDFRNKKYFDENFFMYLENDDFCKRLSRCNQNIYIIPKSKIKHLGAKAVSDEYAYEVELSRNWHWIWSRFYYNKKHSGFLYALINGLPVFLSATAKVLFYFFINKKKKQIYLQRCRGYLNALFGKKSFYRPKINF